MASFYGNLCSSDATLSITLYYATLYTTPNTDPSHGFQVSVNKSLAVLSYLPYQSPSPPPQPPYPQQNHPGCVHTYCYEVTRGLAGWLRDDIVAFLHIIRAQHDGTNYCTYILPCPFLLVLLVPTTSSFAQYSMFGIISCCGSRGRREEDSGENGRVENPGVCSPRSTRPPACHAYLPTYLTLFYSFPRTRLHY